MAAATPSHSSLSRASQQPVVPLSLDLAAPPQQNSANASSTSPSLSSSSPFSSLPSAAARSVLHRQKRIRRAGLWSLVLPTLLQHNITIQTKRNQHIHGTLTHVTLDLNLTLTNARSHYPTLTRTQPAPGTHQAAAKAVAVCGGGRRSVRVEDVWLSSTEYEEWSEVVVSVRHVRCVIPPTGFQLQSAVERQERKRQQGQRLYARRKFNVNKPAVG